MIVEKATPAASNFLEGDVVEATVRVRSKGGAGYREVRVKAVLSADRRAGAGDTVIGRTRIARLRAGSSRRLRLSGTLSQQLAGGDYWLVICASGRIREADRTNDCASSKGQVRVNVAGGSGSQPQPPSPGSPPLQDEPSPEPEPGGPEPQSPPLVTAKLGHCRPALTLSAQADRPAVPEGSAIEYSASVRNDPNGACLEVEGAQTLSGAVAVRTPISDIAMWLEIDDGAGRRVLPTQAGLFASGVAAPEACPGEEVAGCEAGIQEIVGNVFYPEGKAREVGPGEEAEIPFRFFPTLDFEDLEQVANAPAGAIHLVVAAKTEDDQFLLARAPVEFSPAQPIEEVELAVDLPNGEEQNSPIGSIAPGAEVDLEPAGYYTPSEEDPDTVVASFQANASIPGAISSAPVDVSTVVTLDPGLRPEVFPTASPSAATVGTTATVLVGAALEGSVEEPPAVFMQGPEDPLGVLNDEGLDGDAVAGDGIWTGEVQVPMDETRTLRVDALIDGLWQSGTVEVQALPVGAPTGPAAESDQQTITLGDGSVVLADRIVLEMEDGSSFEEVTAAADKVGGTVVGRISATTWQIGISPVADEGELNAALANVSTAAGVIGAEPEEITEETDVRPNDSFYGSQWYLPKIEANRAWIVARGGSPRVVVAVLDTGVDRDHPDLASRLLPGHDFANGDNNPEDTCGHGTHVAGIIGAVPDNHKLVAGVNWNVALLPVKVFPDVAGPAYCHTVGSVNLAAAIRWAVDHGAAVINMSLAGPKRSEADVAALEYAWNAGRVVVAAAGNNGSSAKAYPAGYERTEQFSSWFGLSKRTYHTDVLAVGNTTSDDHRSPSSNFGSWVDVSAPGTEILSTYLNGGTETLTGTSMAAPVVSGLASLMISNGILGPERIRNLLVNTGKQINQSIGPRVNAFEAVFNGGFEGGLEGWSPQGTVSTVPRLGPIVPRSGNRMLEISTGPDAAQVRASVRKVMQLRSDALRGGSINLSLKYDFVTEEYPEFVGSEYNDAMRIMIRLPNGETRSLADESVNTTNWTPVSGIDFPGGDSTVGQSGWKTASVSIPASALGGSGDMTIEVFDVGDEIYDSVGLVDSIRFD
ncbi:MAG TPA: S8 family serine peptidase [Solirubrobacterales bacterium]|nr:S8 family serine peptidase [Solirubrobacterales bacterium]